MSKASIGAMSSFLFLAVGPGGARRFGVRAAPSRPALAETLRRERLLLMRALRLPGQVRQRSTLSLADQIVLNEQLAQLVSRGVPLVEALAVVAETVSAGLRPRVSRLRELVASGLSFSQACQRVGGFDPVTVAVYRAAERSGDLAGAGRQLAETARRGAAVAGKALTLAIYPAVVIVIAVGVGLVLIVGVMPTIGSQLEETGAKPPLLTAFLTGLGRWIQGNVLAVAAVAAACLVAAIAARGAVLGWLGVLMRRAPLLRAVVLAQELARFFGVMAAMTRSGVTLGEALATGNQAINHPTLRAEMDRLRQRLVEGGALRELIEQVASLPIATRKLLIAAERTGDLESAFVTLAGDMAAEVDRRSARLVALLQPLTVVVMFLIIGTILLAVLIPILTLSQNIGT